MPTAQQRSVRSPCHGGGGLERTHLERGVSSSVLVAGVLPALIMVAGLAVDGASQVSLQRSAQVLAASAARAGADAAAGYRLAGQDGTAAALAAAQQHLSGHPELQVSVHLDPNGDLVVHTQGSVRTMFLSILGIDQLTASGQASATLRPR